MFCSACGSEVVQGAAFCPRCGQPVGVATAAMGRFSRPGVITVLAVLQFIAAAVFLPAGAIAAIALIVEPPRDPVAIAGCLILLAGGVFMLLCGIGLWRLKSYGRILQMIGAGIGLLAIPLGTIISIAILVYLSKPGVKLLFSGRAPETLTPEERAQVAAAQSAPGAVIIVVIIGLLLFSIFFIGIIAAIAIPGLLRARLAANEATAIGTLRTLQSGEVVFSQTAGGSYGTPECLSAPDKCLPNYSGSPFVAEPYSSQFTKSGYRFWFVSVAPRATAATGLVDSFAVYAAPVSLGTGSREFCTDSRGTIVSNRATGLPPPMEPACPAGWSPIQ